METVFVRYPSHRGYDRMIVCLGYRPKSYYRFGTGKNWLELRASDFPKIEWIPGVKVCKPHPDMRPSWPSGAPDRSWRAKYPKFEDLYSKE